MLPRGPLGVTAFLGLFVHLHSKKVQFELLRGVHVDFSRSITCPYPSCQFDWLHHLSTRQHRAHQSRSVRMQTWMNRNHAAAPSRHRTQFPDSLISLWHLDRPWCRRLFCEPLYRPIPTRSRHPCHMGAGRRPAVVENAGPLNPAPRGCPVVPLPTIPVSVVRSAGFNNFNISISRSSGEPDVVNTLTNGI